MAENIFLELQEVLKAERPVNVGFQHTEYAKRLLGVALRFQDRLYREDVERFHTDLFMEADAYRESYGSLINHNTWDGYMNQMKTVLDPSRFRSKHETQAKS